MVAAIGFVLSLSAFTALVTTSASRETRFGIFVPLFVMTIGWVQSRKKFCLAYGLTGTFNFGKMGQVIRYPGAAFPVLGKLGLRTEHLWDTTDKSKFPSLQ